MDRQALIIISSLRLVTPLKITAYIVNYGAVIFFCFRGVLGQKRKAWKGIIINV